MIQYLNHKSINKKKWDELISSSPQEIVYAYSWFLDCVCPDWEALVKDDYEAVIPLTQNKKASVSYLYQPFFTQQLGVFSKKEMDEKAVDEFLENIPDKFRFVEINLNTKNIFSSKDFKHEKKITHHLFLSKPHDKIQARYNENTKRNLKRAIKHELKISPSIKPVELINMFRKTQGKKISELKKQHYTLLENLMKKSLQLKRGKLVGTKDETGKWCAGCFFVYGKNSIINLFPASTDAAKQNGAMTFLIDSCLKENEMSGKNFDFEGSNISSIARFYKGFGAAEVNYFRIRRNQLPWLFKWLKK